MARCGSWRRSTTWTAARWGSWSERSRYGASARRPSADGSLASADLKGGARDRYGGDGAGPRSSPAVGLARGIAARGRARQALDDQHPPAAARAGRHRRLRLVPFLLILAAI